MNWKTKKDLSKPHDSMVKIWTLGCGKFVLVAFKTLDLTSRDLDSWDVTKLWKINVIYTYT